MVSENRAVPVVRADVLVKGAKGVFQAVGRESQVLTTRDPEITITKFFHNNPKRVNRWGTAVLERRRPTDIRRPTRIDTFLSEHFESFLAACFVAVDQTDEATAPIKTSTPHPETIKGLVSASKAAELIDMKPATVIKWIEAERMLGWRSSGRNYIVPLEQIEGPRSIYPGIADVIARFDGNSKRAWWYLNKPRAFGARRVRPMDLIKEGGTSAEQAIANAGGYNDGGL